MAGLNARRNGINGHRSEGIAGLCRSSLPCIQATPNFAVMILLLLSTTHFFNSQY